MDYRNIVIGAMVILVALLIGFNVAMFMGSQDHNITQLDWANNSTLDMRYANESPINNFTDNVKNTTTKRNKTNNTGGLNNTEPEPEPVTNETK